VIQISVENDKKKPLNLRVSAWLDGKLVGNVEKLRFRHTEGGKIRRFAVLNYFGGDNSWQTSPKDQRIYIDNLVISRRPIGCLNLNP